MLSSRPLFTLYRLVLSLPLSVLLFSQAQAIVPPLYDKDPSPLKAEAELGFIFNKTNSRNTAFNNRLKFNYKSQPFALKKTLDQVLTLRYYYAKDDQVTSSQKGQAEYQANYNLNSDSSLFGRATMEHDRFASYIDQQTISAGYIYKFYDFTKLQLQLEIGPGYRISRPNEDSSSDEGLTEMNEPIIRSAIVWSQRFTTNLKISSDLAIELGDDNTVSSVNGRIENHLLGNLALVFEVRYRYTEVVPADTVNTEIFSNFNLLYTF